jgi:hypothetical protein
MPHDPLLIGRVQVNTRREGSRPLHHRRVKMRVRDRDGVDSPEPFDHRYGRIIKRADTIPQNISIRSTHQQRTLTDGECRHRSNADNAVLVFAESIGVALLKSLKRRPSLTARRYVLAFFFANHATNRRLRAFRILRAARGTNVKEHRCISFQPACVIIL